MSHNIPTRGFALRHHNPQNTQQVDVFASAPRLVGRMATPFTQPIRTVVWAAPGRVPVVIVPEVASAQPFDPWQTRGPK